MLKRVGRRWSRRTNERTDEGVDGCASARLHYHACVEEEVLEHKDERRDEQTNAWANRQGLLNISIKVDLRFGRGARQFISKGIC